MRVEEHRNMFSGECGAKILRASLDQAGEMKQTRRGWVRDRGLRPGRDWKCRRFGGAATRWYTIGFTSGPFVVYRQQAPAPARFASSLFLWLSFVRAERRRAPDHFVQTFFDDTVVENAARLRESD